MTLYTLGKMPGELINPSGVPLVIEEKIRFIFQFTFNLCVEPLRRLATALVSLTGIPFKWKVSTIFGRVINGKALFISIKIAKPGTRITLVT
jgi:hypothetical protein